MGITYVGSSHAVIDAPGDYTIDRDMTQTDPAASCLTINPGVHFVNIRLRSRLVYAGPPSGLGAGIGFNGNAAVTIMGDGGSINGFPYGINAPSSNLLKIKDVPILSALFQGIYMIGPDCIIQGCDIRNVTGSTAYSPSRNFGIQVSGPRPKLFRNYVENVIASEEAVGISITDQGVDGIICQNIVKCSVTPPPLPSGLPASYGYWIGGASKVSFEQNMAIGWAVGVAASSPPTVDYGGNRFVGCTLDSEYNNPADFKSTTDA